MPAAVSRADATVCATRDLEWLRKSQNGVMLAYGGTYSDMSSFAVASRSLSARRGGADVLGQTPF